MNDSINAILSALTMWPLGEYMLVVEPVSEKYRKYTLKSSDGQYIVSFLLGKNDTLGGKLN